MTGHIPVMLKETLRFLEAEREGLFLDCTFGGGGHSCAILDFNKKNRVVALDCDPEAVERAQAVKKAYGDRFKFYDLNFGQLGKIEENGFTGILFDLGVSSFQLDTPQRGFSFRFESQVDMRLNPREGISAAEFLETATRQELQEAIRDYGEETRWKTVVNAILKERGTGVLAQTALLAEMLEKLLGRKRGDIHPATKTFQGIRIAINNELGVLESALPSAFSKLAIDGVLAVISFHSLEDRIVKRFFKKMAGKPEHSEDSTPQQMRTVYGNILTKNPVTSEEEETALNPRSRSAKLRVFRKTK